jgi:tetratricopeptide (TPR) repeat protein
MDWRERYERAAARYSRLEATAAKPPSPGQGLRPSAAGAGTTRERDERRLVALANSAWAAGLSLLMDGDREEAAEWLRRSAERYRESWEAGGAPDAWGRPIGALKALLIAGDDASESARWTLETCLGIRYLDMSLSPIGRYAGVLALLVLGRDEEAAAVAGTLGDGFPGDVAAALSALANHDSVRYREAVASVRRAFEERAAFLEDVPVPDTALALDVLAASRGLG